MANGRWMVALIAATATLAGCAPDDANYSSGTPSTPGSSSGVPSSPGSSNTPPTISGQPSTEASSGSTWTFQPAATDSDGDALTFRASGLPGWASINPQTGQVFGTPGSNDIGMSGEIVVSVSDGDDSTSLPRFRISVSAGTDVPPASASGTASLTWVPPVEYTNGTVLAASDLTGYRIYHGTSVNALNDIRDVAGADATSYRFDGLASGTHFFAVTAVTIAGTESSLSSIGSKLIL